MYYKHVYTSMCDYITLQLVSTVAGIGNFTINTNSSMR